MIKMGKIPKIDFVYSSVYDKTLNELIEDKDYLKIKPEEEPRLYIKKIKERWDKISDSVLKDLSDITELSWREERIKCYIISIRKNFSDPMTIRYYKDVDRFIETLLHELVHQILIRNSRKLKKSREKIYETYPSLSKISRTHIIVHSILKKLLLKNLGGESLEREIKIASKSEDYKIAWDIVLEKGEDEIINSYKENYLN